jgi:hypothetical protein
MYYRYNGAQLAPGLPLEPIACLNDFRSPNWGTFRDVATDRPEAILVHRVMARIINLSFVSPRLNDLVLRVDGKDSSARFLLVWLATRGRLVPADQFIYWTNA